MDTDVIVAGAGPVGMSAAILLHRTGLSVRVLERERTRSTFSRATTLHPRTLELLDTLTGPDGVSVAERLVTLGLPTPAAHYATLPSMLSYENIDSRFPFALMVPQPVTERVLAEHAAACGLAVETGREVVAVDQDPDRVRVRTRDGEVSGARALLGADGAHSVVRHRLGIAMRGTAPDTVGVLADVHLDRVPEHAHHWAAGIGRMSVVAMPGGWYRVFGQDARFTGLSQDQVAARRDEPVTHDELATLLDRTTGGQCSLGEILWASRSTNAARRAETLRRGRVLLAGDAAHVHLPAAGQGLNVGIQDAANLTWKLAAELAGWAPERLVTGAQSYQTERLPVIDALLADTRAQAALMQTFTEDGQALRERFSALIARDGDTAAVLRAQLSGIDLAYPTETGGAHADLAGRRVPDLALRAGGGLHRGLDPSGLTLVALRPGVDVTAYAGPRVSTLRANRGWGGAGAVLVRPDGYAARAWSADEVRDAAAVRRELDAWRTADRAEVAA